jgi:hypothetical protein
LCYVLWLMRRPALFVSSTCYDLRQVRADVKIFAEGVGLEPLLSEHNSFPVNPDLGAVDNCLTVVNTKADIFLLIVGARYGSVVDGGKSITNLEYLTARAKGIPVYAFVSRALLDLLPVWRENPSGNFTSVTDSPKLLQFITELRENGSVWVFPFDTAQDIFEALRAQLAYLFMESLELRQRVRAPRGLSPTLSKCPGSILRLIVERPPLWEYSLFGQALEEELRGLIDRRRDWQYGLALGRGLRMSLREFDKWMRLKISEAERMIQNGRRIVNEVLPVALGPAGSSGDAESLLHVASRLASVYENALEWKLDFLKLDLHSELTKLREITSHFCDTLVSDLEKFSKDLQCGIQQAVKAQKAGEPYKLNITLRFGSGGGVLSQIEQELTRLGELFESGELDPNSI